MTNVYNSIIYHTEYITKNTNIFFIVKCSLFSICLRFFISSNFFPSFFIAFKEFIMVSTTLFYFVIPIIDTLYLLKTVSCIYYNVCTSITL